MTWVHDLINLVYPECCQGCRTPLVGGETHLCLHCESELPLVREPNPANGLMHKIFYGRIPISYGTSLVYFRKGDLVQEVMHAIKYRGNKPLAQHMGQRMGNHLSEIAGFSSLDYLIPVPLHARKKRQRGFNQSEELAIGMSKAMMVPVNTDLVIRNKHTETQTRKGRFARWQNVASVFDCPEGIFENKHLLLIDDVVTTGATIEACAWPLIRAGAKVSVMTFAMATS
jgi:ComF family protein